MYLYVTINLFSLYLMNFIFHTILDTAGNILKVHYKSMIIKCEKCENKMFHFFCATLWLPLKLLFQFYTVA